VTKPFTHPEILTFCECWGPHPMCWKRGDHVAVGFDRECAGLENEEGRAGLAGTPIQRAVWNPKAFGEDGKDSNSSSPPPAWIPRSDS
jgi:hypothetical protein